VTVLRGEVFDVAVDLRRGAPTYGRWLGVTLSDRNRWTLWVPPGFAHGFCVLSDEADVLYKVTEEYAPDLEGGIRWDDPDLGIDWPIRNPILSPRDAALPFLRDADFPEVWEGTE
jgi:dTDP-4-dehydrorhamnose 3,5-epimerase